MSEPSFAEKALTAVRVWAGRAVLLITLSLFCGVLAASSHSWYQGRDFHCFYVSGRIVASGGDPYDAAQFVPAVAEVGPTLDRANERCGVRLSYPPWTALMLAPFGALSLPAASSLWVALSVFAMVLGIGWTWQLVGRERISWLLVAVLTLFTEPFLLNLAEGQFDMFSFALTAAAMLGLRSDRTSGGVATAALSVKPQVSIGFAAVALVLAVFQRRWRFVGVAAASGLALVVSTQLVRPGWIAEFVSGTVELTGAIPNRATIWNLVAPYGPWTLAAGMVVLLVGAVVLLVRSRPFDEVGVMSVGTALSLVVAPYAWSQAYIVLAIPWSLTFAYATRADPLRRRVLTYGTLIVAGPLLWICTLLWPFRGSESLSVIVPMFTALLVALAIRWRSP